MDWIYDVYWFTRWRLWFVRCIVTRVYDDSRCVSGRSLELDGLLPLTSCLSIRCLFSVHHVCSIIWEWPFWGGGVQLPCVLLVVLQQAALTVVSNVSNTCISIAYCCVAPSYNLHLHTLEQNRNKLRLLQKPLCQQQVIWTALFCDKKVAPVEVLHVMQCTPGIVKLLYTHSLVRFYAVLCQLKLQPLKTLYFDCPKRPLCRVWLVQAESGCMDLMQNWDVGMV